MAPVTTMLMGGSDFDQLMRLRASNARFAYVLRVRAWNTTLEEALTFRKWRFPGAAREAYDEARA
ncbi:hypothetical protein GCM10010253_46610 [Streptomyces badius]|uniref:Uncharacterized protein n=1 Tax=Streptomyces badius TaxID=1941 RepID=A0ABQ2TEB9_STRBA|nr:hypothetical protein GCM10010253_46610 [Streptomyces badius]